MFDLHQGWAPIDSRGMVWCYRQRGSYGVLVFWHDAEGNCSYEVVHQDTASNDTTITTVDKEEAVRFAKEGREEHVEAEQALRDHLKTETGGTVD